MKHLLSRTIFFYTLSIAVILFNTSCKKTKDNPVPVTPTTSVTIATTTFSGNNEVPASGSAATGTFSASYDQSTKILSYTVTYSGMTPTSMHIHSGAIGNNGTVIFTLTTPTSSPSTGSVPLNASQETDLLAGNYYINIHSSTYPSGEVRAQILTSDFKIITADLSGNNEVPASGSAATGNFYSTYNTVTKILSYTVVYSGSATANAMHIHSGAPGLNGGVIFTLATPNASSVSGVTAAFSSAQESDLLSGLYYVNIHSAAYAAGEVRGQLVNDNVITFQDVMNGANESPASGSTATGILYSLYNKTTKVFSYTVFYSGTTPTSMHIHSGTVGNNGAVLYTLATPTASPASGTATINSVDEAALLTGGLYANIHSAAFAAGDIRAQIQ
jgi:hypothetical protein